MKKLLIISAVVYLFSVIASYSSYAQSSTGADYAKNVVPDTGGFFKSNSPVKEENLSTVNTRAMKDFKRSFISGSDEKWYRSIEGGFLVKFVLNGIKNRADYDKKGNWIATTRYYTEKELPKDVRAQVKSVYYDFSISTVEEITFPEHLVYIIHMQDDTKWMNVRICDGEMDIMQEFFKN
jgi:hypothetical protein